MSKVLKVDHVGMRFNLSKEKVDNLKEYAIKLLTKQLKYQEFWAL
ncbi:MAG: ABC-type polysaccharide/polyol phosphate transport system, ATPase component, partial [Anaerocolumna sp.]|nr:ABC-type polysaccharide/polyol phosphate transport system, ATPase component [Anaerocolumna sp.]